MESEMRAAGAFTGVGVVLVGVALLVTHFAPRKSGVDALPAMEPVSAPAAAPAPVAESTTHRDAASVPRLLSRPSLSATQIAFDYAGEIWTVGRQGGEAHRLVTAQLRNWRPIFSPDGSQIAFTGVEDENADVYVVPAAGGEPRRLTYHPGGDVPVGWTPDGKKVLFRSTRATTRDLPHLFTVPLAGGAPEELPVPSGTNASYSPDGQRLAYIPFQQWQPAWRKYRGGQTTPVWIVDLDTSHLTRIPRTDSNDRLPMWVGDSVYFLSDRNGPFTLFAYDVKSAAVRELVKNPDGFDIASASAGPGAIVYAQMGDIFLYDLASGASKRVPITISAELPQVRPRFAQVDREGDPPRGALALGQARAPRDARRDPLRARREGGRPEPLAEPRRGRPRPGLVSRRQVGRLAIRRAGRVRALLPRARRPGPVEEGRPRRARRRSSMPRTWSPDSKKLLLTDKRLNLWLVDTDHPTPVKVDTNPFEGASFDPSVVARLPLGRLQQGARQPLPRARSSTRSRARRARRSPTAAATRGARASIAAGSTSGSSRAPTSAPRWPAGWSRWGARRRAASTPWSSRRTSPLRWPPRATRSPTPGPRPLRRARTTRPAAAGKEADEKGDKAEKSAKEADGRSTSTASTSASSRSRSTGELRRHRRGRARRDLPRGGAGRPVRRGLHEDRDATKPPRDVFRFDLKTRKTETFAAKIDRHAEGGGAVVLGQRRRLARALRARHEVVRRPGGQGGQGRRRRDQARRRRGLGRPARRVAADLTTRSGASSATSSTTRTRTGSTSRRPRSSTRRFLDGIADRDDLNDLLEAGLGNLVLGHVWSDGGDMPPQHHVGVGLLGADYRVEDGRYRIARILRGENWNPALRAPLTEPGIKVDEGDFLLAVDGEPIRADEDVYRHFLGRAGKQTVITVGPRADGAGSHAVTVVPVGSESAAPPPDLDGGQPEEGRRALGRAGRLRLPPGHGRRRAHQLQPLLLLAGRARTRSSSTSASTTAGRSPTTWSRCSRARR